MPRNANPMTAGQPHDRKCGAKTRSGSACISAFLMANGRCRIHGGATPSGNAHPGTIHGRYSKDAPTRLLARLSAAIEDPERLTLQREIALIDARIGEMLARVDAGGAAAIWAELQESAEKYKKLSLIGKYIEAEALLAEIFETITGGMLDAAAWAEIHAALDQRLRFVGAENARLIALSKGLTVDQVSLQFRALVDAIRQETDTDTLQRIHKRFSGLAGQRPHLAAG